jgi:hypothetical protein
LIAATFDTFRVFSKEWANEQLKVANEFLKEGFQSEKFWLWNQRLAAAIIIKTELQGRGWIWQAARINNQIHRYQGKINRLRKKECEHEWGERGNSPRRGKACPCSLSSRLQAHQGLTSEQRAEEASY